MKKQLLLSVLTCLFISEAEKAFSQDFTKRNRYTTFGLSATAANYYGDLTPGPSALSTDLELTRPNLGVYATRRYYPHFSARVSFSWSRLKGDDGQSAKSSESQDAGRWQRNLSFRNDIKELAVVGIYDLIANYGVFQKRNEYSPYIFGGIAVFQHNPKAHYKGNLMKEGWYDLQPLQTEGIKYSKTQVSIPFGLGVRCRLNAEMDLGFEIGWRRTFTDYLDDVSSNYAEKGQLNQANGTAAWVLSDRSIEVPELRDQQTIITGSDDRLYPISGGVSSAGMQRGDKTMKDWYILTGFTFSYIIDPDRKTPKFR